MGDGMIRGVGGDREAGGLELMGDAGHRTDSRVVRSAGRQEIGIQFLAEEEVVLAQDLVQEGPVVGDGGGHPEVGVDSEGDVGLELQIHREGSFDAGGQRVGTGSWVAGAGRCSTEVEGSCGTSRRCTGIEKPSVAVNSLTGGLRASGRLCRTARVRTGGGGVA